MSSPRASLIGFAFLAALALAGCGRSGQPQPGNEEPPPAQIKDFAVLYRQNCAGCHGLDGNGGAALALSNPVYLAVANDEQLRAAITGGVPKTLMPAFAQSAGGMLTAEQVEIIIKGIRKWAKPEALSGAVPPPYFAPLGDAARGAAAFALACADCHGADGKGTAKSQSIVDGSYLALVSDQNLRTTVIAGRPDLKHPDWRHTSAGRPLTPEEVSDIVAWLVSQRAPLPGQPYPQSR